MLEQQLAQQLRRYIPEGVKEEGGLYATTLRELGKLLSFQRCLEIMQQRDDVERKAILDTITLPIMQRCGQSTSEHKFNMWYKTLIVTQRLYQIIDMETAVLLKQQVKGQARGCLCRSLKDEDYEKREHPANEDEDP